MGLGDDPVVHPLDELSRPRGVGTGHDEVEAGGHALDGAGDREPVRDDDAVVPPLVLRDRLQQLVVLGGRGPVDQVVGGHQGPGVRVGEHHLEGCEVHLAHRLLVHAHIDGGALGLRLVAEEVLEARPDAALLQPRDVGAREAGGEQRVLAERLEEPAAERGAVEVDRRTEHHVGALVDRLLGQDVADLRQRRLVPGLGEQASVRQQAALPPADDHFAAHAGRAVGEDDRLEADRGFAGEGELGGTGEQADLLLEAQGAHGGGPAGGAGSVGGTDHGHFTFLIGRMRNAPTSAITAARMSIVSYPPAPPLLMTRAATPGAST